MKILIIRFSSIGDIVLTTPVIRCLQQQLKAEVHFISKRGFEPVLRNNPYLHRIWLIEKDTNEVLQELKAEKFDFIVDLHNNLRSRKLTLSLGVPVKRLNKLNFKKWLVTSFRVNCLPKVHIVDRYLDTLKQLKVENDHKGLDYFCSNEETELAKKMLKEHQLAPHSFDVIVLGGAHSTKIFPIDNLREVLSTYHEPLALLGGPDEQGAGDQLASEFDHCISFCGKTSLNLSAAILSFARAVLSNDTGLMHIAAAMKKPVLSVWGNTIPDFGMTPYYGNSSIPSYVAEVENLGCRPCSKIGYRNCPKEHFHCMQHQNNAKIAEVMKTLSSVNEMEEDE